MQKHILAFVFAAQAVFAAPPVVSNVQFLYGSHSSVTVQFDESARSNDIRIRYIPVSQGSCDQGNPAATVQTFGFSSIGFTTGIQMPVSGLAANTKYEFCPEVSNDGGSTWSTTGGSNPAGATFTTLPLPSPHPALPIHPATFDTSYPDTSQGTCWSTGQPGYCTVTVTVNSTDCPDLSSDIATAIQHQKTSGTIVEIPAGATCTNNMSWTQISPDAIAYNSSAVSNNTITLTNNGLGEGQGVMFSPQEMNSNGVYFAQPPSGIVSGYIYFVHVVDANHFQLYQNWQQETGNETSGSNQVVLGRLSGWASSPGISVGEEIVGAGIPAGTTISAIDQNSKTLTLSQAATATASGVTFTFGGPLLNIGPYTGSYGQYSHFVPWPRQIPYWVIVRTSTPDSQFAPEGTRVNPSWAPKMAVLESTGNMLFQPYVYATHIRFTGIEWTWKPTTEVASDPVSHEAIIHATDNNSDIIFDRNWFHGPGGIDDRVHEMIFLDGMDEAIIDSYWDNLTYWHASYSWPGKLGLYAQTSQTPSGTVGSTSFTVPPTTVHYGAANPATLPNTLTVSWTGTPASSISTPEIAVYFDMNGNLNIAAPQGLSVAASAGNVSYTTASGNGSCTEGDPMIPRDAQGREAAAPLGCAKLNASGQMSASPVAGRVAWGSDTEGCQCFIGGVGPGPYQISNNYISGSGLLVHFDNSGHMRWRGDYLIRRNTFHVPMEDLDDSGNPYAQQAGIPSNGYWYGHRQVLEWKGGEREWIDGNVFDGGFADVNHNSPFDVTAHSGDSYGISDMDVTNNTIQHYPLAMGAIDNVMDNNGNNPPFTSLRFRAYNNLSWDINGWVYSTSGAVGFGVGTIGEGSFLGPTGGPNEDFVFDHNTVYDMNGMMDGEFWDSRNGPDEGTVIINNILPYSMGPTQQHFFIQANANLNSDACAHTTQTNESGTNCSFIAGVGNPDLVFEGNLLIPGWAKSQYPEGGSQVSMSTIQSDWPDYYNQNTIITESGVVNALNAVGWQAHTFTRAWADAKWSGTEPNFRLRSASSFNHAQTTDGKPVGADINALQAAQGKVTLVGTNQITTSAATVSYVAPDNSSCSVDYSSTDPTVIHSFTRVQDGGGTRSRSVRITGLSPHTTYHYRINCAVQQPTGQFVTN